MHLLGTHMIDAAPVLVAYARCLPKGLAFAEISIGRVVTRPSARGMGLGHPLVKQAIAACIDTWGPQPIRIGAQARLKDFYRQHGFVDVVLIGDHGGYQTLLGTVATHINRDWATSPARAHFIGEYYRATEISYPDMLRTKGLSDMQIGTHAGTADTSLMMAVDTTLVRSELMSREPSGVHADGVAGDPRPSTAALGQLGVDLIVDKTVAAIRAALKVRR